VARVSPLKIPNGRGQLSLSQLPRVLRTQPSRIPFLPLVLNLEGYNSKCLPCGSQIPKVRSPFPVRQIRHRVLPMRREESPQGEEEMEEVLLIEVCCRDWRSILLRWWVCELPVCFGAMLRAN